MPRHLQQPRMGFFLLAVTIAAAAATNQVSSDFDVYTKTYAPHLTAGTPEYLEREKIFTANRLIVDDLNAQHDGAEFSLESSPFSHLTFEEFAARLPRMGAASAQTQSTASVTTSSAPTSFDWRTNTVKAVTPVKDQVAHVVHGLLLHACPCVTSPRDGS